MNLFTSVAADLVHAGRSLAKARAFTFVCVVTLGIGMAPVIAIHYWMRVFTTPPPGVKTEGLVEVVTTSNGPQGATDKWSYPDFLDLREAATGLSLTGWAIGQSDVTLPSSGEKRTSPTLYVSSNYFTTIGTTLARGSGFEQSTDPMVILGDEFWQNRLGSDPDIVGKTLMVDGVPHAVVGIASERFTGHRALQGAEIFVPLERHPSLLAGSDGRFDRSKPWVRIQGQLSPGVGMAQANAAISAVASRLAKTYPATNEFKAGIVAPYHPLGSVEGSDVPVIMAVWRAMSAIPLLVVCLNVSGMVQVRSAMRERELSIRQAIGATRRRLMQHLLAEAVVLASLGGALASLVLFNAPPLVSRWIGEPMPRELEEMLRVDWSVVGACAGLCLATSLLFGWLPAFRFSRPAIMTVLKDEAGSGGVRAGRAHRLTTALQVAIAVPLLVLSAMSLDRVRATATADLGFAADLLYAAPIEMAAGDVAGSRVRRVRESLGRASGVASVTIADGLPLDFRYRLARVSSPTDGNAAPGSALAHVTRVGDGYLETMGIGLTRGRGFTLDDGAGAEMVTIISKKLADALFPDTEAIGRHLTFERREGQDGSPHTLTVIGITGDFPTSQMSSDREQLLLPLAQHPDIRRDSVRVSDDRQGSPALMIVARSRPGEPPQKLTAALTNAIHEVDPAFDSTAVLSGAQLRRDSMYDFLNQSAFAGITGGVALLLAALGLYGVVGLMVSTRTREIAVRMTLGASRPRVIGMILLDVVKLVAPGVAVGLLIAVVAVRAGGGVAVTITEPLAYIAGAAIALITAVLSSLVPARRAASVEPMVAMRSE
jgi:predicted permease